MANEGSSAVYIQPFPPTGGKYQVATGGRTPAWSPDGKQLFFHSIRMNQFMVVDIRAEHGLTQGTPTTLPIEDAVHPLTQRNYDVTPDGKQLVIVLPPQTAQAAQGRRPPLQMDVVLNWFEELKRLVPARQPARTESRWTGNGSGDAKAGDLLSPAMPINWEG